jgi:hypothetical protein
MTVDDDPGVLRAVEHDLRRQYGNRYRIVATDSGASAPSAVEQIKSRRHYGIWLFCVRILFDAAFEIPGNHLFGKRRDRAGGRIG